MRFFICAQAIKAIACFINSIVLLNMSYKLIAFFFCFCFLFKERGVLFHYS